MFEYKETEKFDIGASLGVYEYDFFTINGEEDFQSLINHYTTVYKRFDYFPDGYNSIVENNTDLSPVVKAKMKEHNANLCLTFLEKKYYENDVCIRKMIVNEQKPKGIYKTYIFTFFHFVTMRARDDIERGIAYAEYGFQNAAIVHFTRAINLDPSMGIAFLNRGISYMARKNYDKAIEDFTQAININPEESTAFSFRGLAYKKAGDFDKAKADFAKALQINPVDEKTKKYFEEISKFIEPVTVELSSEVIDTLPIEEIIYAEFTTSGAMDKEGGVMLYIIKDDKLVCYANIYKDKNIYNDAVAILEKNSISTRNNDKKNDNGIFKSYGDKMGNYGLINKNVSLKVANGNIIYTKNNNEYKIYSSVHRVFDRVVYTILKHERRLKEEARRLKDYLHDKIDETGTAE